MIKKIITGALATVVVGAAGVSAYNTSTTSVVSTQTAEAALPAPIQQSYQAEENAGIGEPQGDAYGQDEAQGQGFGQTDEQGLTGNQNQEQGQAQELGQSQTQGGGNGYHGGREDWTPGSGNNNAAQTTIHGTLVDVGLASVTLISDEGQTISFALNDAPLGLTLLPGETLTVGGYWNADDSFTAGQITLDSTGETYSLRGDFGGNNTGRQGGGGKNN